MRPLTAIMNVAHGKLAAAITILALAALLTPVFIPKTASQSSESIQTDFLALVNAERSSLGKTPLIPNSQLESAAYLHSEDMGDNNYFDHTSQDGTTFSRRITNAGYKWVSCSENIAKAYGAPDAAEVYDMWKNSAGHYANMVGDYADAGLGVYTINGYTYYTLDLGRSQSSPIQTPTPRPTASPTPTPQPTAMPTPTPNPTAMPTPAPTITPTQTPTPTATPTQAPMPMPTATPTPKPTVSPTPTPTPSPTATPAPTQPPTATPTPKQTTTPTQTTAPTQQSTTTPTPTREPTTIADPTDQPIRTAEPTSAPTATPSPTPQPPTGQPTVSPTPDPTVTATPVQTNPTPKPSTTPNTDPTDATSAMPTPTQTVPELPIYIVLAMLLAMMSVVFTLKEKKKKDRLGV